MMSTLLVFTLVSLFVSGNTRSVESSSFLSVLEEIEEGILPLVKHLLRIYSNFASFFVKEKVGLKLYHINPVAGDGNASHAHVNRGSGGAREGQGGISLSIFSTSPSPIFFPKTFMLREIVRNLLFWL
jgi:hypothetical protein